MVAILRRFDLLWLALLACAFGPHPVVAADEPPVPGQVETQRRLGLDPTTPLASRVGTTPASVLTMFTEAGLPRPTAHVLTDPERAKLIAAVEALPPLHRRVLRDRLHVISFLDGMPNSALTSMANPNEPYHLFDITVNAAFLRLNVSEWLTQKERTCFNARGSALSVSVDAGSKVDALVYLLLHEATHIVDNSLGLTPPFVRTNATVPPAAKPPVTPFTEGVWASRLVPIDRYLDPIRPRILFNGSVGALPIEQSRAAYLYLRRTPFVSLYGGSSWYDDLAEYLAVYHLTEVLKQPFRIVIRDGDHEVFSYEPMKSALVRERIGPMKRFYEIPQ